jgi:hypothetical protein
METLKMVCLTVILLVKQALFVPQTVALALQQRRRQILLDKQEVERLDRLRNPSNYQGK